MLGGCAQEMDRTPEGRVWLSVWHPWGGTQGPAFQKIIEAFERMHPGVKVRAVYTPNDLSNNQKFFTSVAAAKPPDVIFVDGPQVAEWAERGALAPMDAFVKADGVRAEDFFAPCWRQNEYKGHVWALTFCADPNFGFVWNRKLFREAGLDPDRPPETIAEMDSYAYRLTQSEADGSLTRIGIIPWNIYGSTNSLFTWGWAFGGSFYDEKARRITANDPKVVKALEWMCSYARRYNINRIASLQAGFGTADLDPFYIGKLAMTCLHIFGIHDIARYAPDLDYGVGYIPAPPGGEPHSSWVGGWCISIPAGSRHPKEAWELIRWICATPEGTMVMAQETGFFPGYRRSPAFERVRKKKYYGMYLKIMEECRHQRPVMPAQAYYMGALQRAVDAALYGKKTPQQALDDATLETQRELDLILKGQ